MLGMDFSVSEDTQAALLLCGILGKNNGDARPLTLPQYNALAQALVFLGKRPADLLHDGNLAEMACSQPVDNARLKEPASPDRLKALLDRGFALSMALNRWAQYGVRPLGRGDALYPSKLKQHLKGKAPAILYCAGNELLGNGGGMAFVGSRDISEEATDAIRRVVCECVEAGMSIVSGGARGADQTSMRTALECGGNVVAALPGDLLKTCLVRENREAIAAGRVLLFSAVDPDERFSPINAMDRNKLIYGMADFAFVAQSDTKGGTWTGAVEELKRPEHRPVYVYMGHARVEGCAKLVDQGGIPWSPSDSLQTMLAKDSAPTVKAPGNSQLSLFDFMATGTGVNDGSETDLCHVSESSEPYASEPESGVFHAVLPMVSAAAGPEGRTSKVLKNMVDPHGFLAGKGWELLLEKACSNGELTRTEKPKKRGKPDAVYAASGMRTMEQRGMARGADSRLAPTMKEVPPMDNQGEAFQLPLFEIVQDSPLSYGVTSKHPSFPAPHAASKGMDVCSALVSVLVAELSKTSHAECTFRKAVDPDRYISHKGWKMVVETACADGAIVRREKMKKRGKPEVYYVLP